MLDVVSILYRHAWEQITELLGGGIQREKLSGRMFALLFELTVYRGAPRRANRWTQQRSCPQGRKENIYSIWKWGREKAGEEVRHWSRWHQGFWPRWKQYKRFRTWNNNSICALSKRHTIRLPAPLKLTNELVWCIVIFNLIQKCFYYFLAGCSDFLSSLPVAWWSIQLYLAHISHFFFRGLYWGRKDSQKSHT